MDLEPWDFQAVGHQRATGRLPLDDRLARRNDQGVIGPIRNNFFDVLSTRRRIGPFRIPLQQARLLGSRIERGTRAAPERTTRDEQQKTCTLHLETSSDRRAFPYSSPAA